MAKSRFQYVKTFELDDRVLPECWLVVRLDGKAFTKFSLQHEFEKPNDARALNLMDRGAQEVMAQFPDIVIAYGESDEYSFVFHKNTSAYGRRSSKILSLVVSCFTSNYVLHWPEWFKDCKLKHAPTFDGRLICYPSLTTLRDYLAWRQADAHINNQYNTCFWALVHSGETPSQAQDRLRGTVSSEKNELLYSRFNINYNTLPEQFKKGSVVVRASSLDDRGERRLCEQPLSGTVILHTDIIKDTFWQMHPDILADRRCK